MIPDTELCEQTPEPPTGAPAEQTDKPAPTEQPLSTPGTEPTGKPETDTPTEEDFDPEEDIWVYRDIGNRDWNMEMIHADSAAMKKEREKKRGAVRVALLDSGVNYSDEVYVSQRKNFVPGQDDYSELGDVFQSDPDRASLDRDVTDASGAETISIHNIEEGGLYLFLVRNFRETTRGQLEESGAVLRVYRKNETKPFYTAEVPAGSGYYWNAFYLWGDTGEILPVDTITDEAME